MNVRFSTREVLDLGAAWVALGVAFTLLIGGPRVFLSTAAPARFALRMLTVRVGCLLPQLGHKVTAIHFGKRAEVRADSGMLAIAIVVALGGCCCAAPVAV